MNAEVSALSFLVSTALLFFLPGFFFLRSFFNRESLTSFEVFLYSFALSIGFIDFLMILLGKLDIRFTGASISLGIISLLSLLFLAAFIYRKFVKVIPAVTSTPSPSLTFSKYQSWCFLLLVVLTVLIKTIYLSHAVLPTATDLGHHMYWSKLISETGSLPFYGKQEIVSTPSGAYELSDDPKAIADFIIGEHLPFSALNIFSNTDYFSAFPVVFLLLINLLSVFALSFLAYRLALEIQKILPSRNVFRAENIALATLFLFGPLYSLASPQAKFVSGGVVGNTFGNLFIPLIILAYYRAFKEKSVLFLTLGFFLTFTLAYTHHLSTFILLFALTFSAILYLVFHFDEVATTLREWFRLILHPLSLILILFMALFFFMVAMPTYIETNALGTAVGTPTKSTRTGLSLYQITFSSGEARVALGLTAILLVVMLRSRMTYAGAFLLGWSLILIIMTMRPDWVLVDIPSNRIGAYLSFPLGILAAFAFVWLASFIQGKKASFFIPSFFVLVISLSVYTFTLGSGSYDNSQTLLPQSKGQEALETFNATRYLAERVESSNVVLKDHNYIPADSWMKLFFLRDYSYPLSRGFFKRYEDNPNREQCTLLMISVPNTPQGEKCYAETGTNLIVVSSHFDAAQFEKSEKFSRIYESKDIHIYLRNSH